jgi:carboxymethylenebutenolidase
MEEGRMGTKSQRLELSVPGAPVMSAYLARPTVTGRSPGLLLFQEAYGVNGHMRRVADRLAEQGYVTLAPELYHRTAPGFAGAYGDFAAVRPHLDALTTEGLEADATAAYRWLANDGGTDPARIGAIGFCMGGRAAYVANAALPLAAAVSFYGGGIAPGLLDRATRLHGPMLLFWGGRDARITPELHRSVADALRTGGRPFVDVEMSEGEHGFFCDERSSYHAASAAQAWALTLAFLATTLVTG